jgi:CubicO group peptidase (beta-lactamase class C family)
MSVPGGSHWGGGVSISAWDQALIGLMLMQGGQFKGKSILSREWVARMQQPCDVAPYYGYLIWLNQAGHLFEAAPRTSWFAIGAGSSITWVDPAIQLVCVLRWIDAAKTNECIARVMGVIGER